MINYQVYKGLCLFLARLAKAYSEEGLSFIPDEEYDRKIRLIREYEEAHPSEIHPKSPTRTVGTLKKGVDTITHIVPMQSLDNALDLAELKAFIKQVVDQFGPNTKLVLEPKYDGLAADLTYLPDTKTEATLVQAGTRGDGVEGEDITRNIMLTNIVKRIKYGDSVNVRGELMLEKQNFLTINASLGPKEKPFANPRNAIAGLLRRKQLGADLAKYIEFYPYEIVGAAFENMDRTEKLAQIAAWYPGKGTHTVIEANYEKIEEVIQGIRHTISTMDIEYDGIVVKVDSAHHCHEMGTRTNNPRWAIAYKFPPVMSKTVILDFVWQVGRTGECAPVAKVAPTQVGGVVVDSALAHNIDLIRIKDWRVGDTVDIYRSGEVIPKLGEIYIESRPANSAPLRIPTNCPCCGSPLEKVGPTLYCLNKSGCQDQLLYEYDYIFSREVFDVEGFSEKTIEQIVKKGMVTRAADFFDLTAEDFLTLDGFAELSANKLEAAFQAARTQPLEKVIQAFCIPDVGASTSRNIARAIASNGGNIETFFQSTNKELMEIDDVGKTTAGNIRWCFDDPRWMDNARRLVAKLKIEIVAVASIVYRANITDKRFVITGVLPESREHIAKTLGLFGAKVGESVSSKTDYLIVGANPSPKKVSSAVKHEVTMLDYNQYRALFDN